MDNNRFMGTPWKIEEGRPYILAKCNISSFDWAIIKCLGEKERIRPFETEEILLRIVTCVNSHDKFVNTLEQIANAVAPLNKNEFE